MNRPRRARLAGLAGLAALAVAASMALLPATAASAHDFLVSSSPADGSTVTESPGTVSLTFNDLVLDLAADGSSSIVEVTGPDAQTTHYETGCASILGRTVSAPVALGTAGVYRVSWQIVSSDGHPVSSSLTFTYAPPAGTAVSAGAASAPPCGRAAAGESGSLPSAAAAVDEGQAGWLILAVAGGIVLLAIVGVVVVLMFSRRKKNSEEIPDRGNPED